MNRIYRQYSFNLFVVNSDGDPISGVSVTLYKDDGTIAFNVLTGFDGFIQEQIVTRGYYDMSGGNSLYDYGPFELVASYNFQTYTVPNIVLYGPISWTIVLD